MSGASFSRSLYESLSGNIFEYSKNLCANRRPYCMKCSGCSSRYIRHSLSRLADGKMTIDSEIDIVYLIEKLVGGSMESADCEDTYADLFALVALYCRGCSDHKSKMLNCTASVLMLALEALITRNTELLTHTHSILLQKDLASKYYRIRIRQPTMAEKILRAFTKYKDEFIKKLI